MKKPCFQDLYCKLALSMVFFVVVLTSGCSDSVNQSKSEGMSQNPRIRVSINDGWRFMKGDIHVIAKSEGLKEASAVIASVSNDPTL
jgi:hypothetical protein